MANIKVYREKRFSKKTNGYYQVLVVECDGYRKNTGFLNTAEQVLLKDIPIVEKEQKEK